jgi:DNA-binding NarL/FixJ family response regulator
MGFTILIADDHALFRKALISLLKKNRPDWNFIEAQDGDVALSIVESHSLEIDVVVLDIQMPKKNGIETSQYIASRFSNIPIAILTQFSDEGLVDFFLREIRAVAFINKSLDDLEIETVLQRVERGERYLNIVMRESYTRIIESLNDKVLTFQFSQRDLEILQRMSLGFTTKEIAKVMHLSPSAVESYRKDLLRVTKTTNAAELIAFGFRSGILQI